jgi:AraC family transcriptional regulator
VTQTEREYIHRINRVLDFIDAHLNESLPLERLAEVASFSKYHFHRIFFAHTGETPAHFIQRLRLEKAARALLMWPNASITEIGFECGFADTTAFARAFKQEFGLSASRFRREHSCTDDSNSKMGKAFRNARKDRVAAPAYHGERIESPRRPQMPALQTDPIPAEYVAVIEEPERTLAYVRHTGPYAGDELLFQRLFTTLYTWAGPRDLVQRGVTEEIVIYHDEPDLVDESRQRVSCCISVPPDTEVSGEIGKMTLPAAKYVKARFAVDATQFGGAWSWVFSNWFPESGYQPADGPCYEQYVDTDPNAEISGKTGATFTVDICVPVKPL